MNLPNLQRAVSMMLALPAVFVLTSCDTVQTKSTSDYATSGSTDGGYNPYPADRNGVAHSGSLLPSNSYGQRVPPPPTGYTPPPMTHNEPSSTSKKTIVSTSSVSATKKSTPPRSSASSTPVKKSTASTSSSRDKPKTTVASKPAPKPSTPSKPAAKKSSGGVRTVVAGDNLWTIARRNNTTVEKLKALNGLSSDKLKLGQKIKLP